MKLQLNDSVLSQYCASTRDNVIDSRDIFFCAIFLCSFANKLLSLETFFRFYCLLNLVMSPGEVKYIGPVGREKQSYIGLHLDSPGNFCL